MNVSHDDLVRLLGGPAAVARRLGIKAPSIYGWTNSAGQFCIPRARLIELGADIERVTAGQLTRQMMFPHDWHLIWPELADRPAPVPAEAKRDGAHV